MPRFWITRGDAAALQSAALTTPNFTVHLACDNPWQTGTASNIVGTIQGTGPMADQNIVIESYLRLRCPSSRPRRRAPSRRTASRPCWNWRAPSRRIRPSAPCCSSPAARTFWGFRARAPSWTSTWTTGGPSPTLDSLKHSLLQQPLPDRTNVLLFSGLDLSSQTGSVGVFYKGVFYDYREDIQSDFSDIGRTMRENAEKIGQTLGFDPATAFADGVNGANGKSWRNYLPGRFAFDAEAATMAGGKGVTFATTDDARQQTDTPADTADHSQRRQPRRPDPAAGLRVLARPQRHQRPERDLAGQRRLADARPDLARLDPAGPAARLQPACRAASCCSTPRPTSCPTSRSPTRWPWSATRPRP